MQSSLPAGWLAFTGRELNPLDRYKRFQIIHPPFLDLAWRKGSFITPSLSSSHSITSSARASSVGGTSRPSALAVFRLMTSLVLGRRLHRQVGRLLALEDAIDVAGRAAILINRMHPIGNQAAGNDEETFPVDRR